MNARKSRGFRDVLLIAACAAVGAGPLLMAAAEDLQYEGFVVVGPDGNGWVSARFPTPWAATTSPTISTSGLAVAATPLSSGIRRARPRSRRWA